MVQIRQETEVDAPVDEIFAAIVDFRGYDRWLPTSSEFKGISEISTDPIALGTTWVERGPNGVRHGTVTEYESPTRVTFHAPMTLEPRFLGSIDITVSLTLTPGPASVQVRRVVTVGLPWLLKPLYPIVVRRFRLESGRTLRALKDFAERSG